MWLRQLRSDILIHLRTRGKKGRCIEQTKGNRSTLHELNTYNISTEKDCE